MIRLSPRHRRFMTSFAIGVLVGAVAAISGISAPYCALLAANGFFIFYLWLMAGLVRSSGPAELRRHAEQSDEGVTLILLLALLAVSVSVAAILMVINTPGTGLAARVLALITLPLGWTMAHLLAAFHYAHLFYRNGGLDFPGDQKPGAWDFLYFSFTIGMTAQVSDIVATNPRMRQAILVHGIASFFYNTGILAIAVNAAITGVG